MTTGILQWVDTERREARVIGHGRRYAVPIDAIESKARYPGARVHFDIDHHADGNVAVNVRLREGTRVSPRQRRFGDLVGARAWDTKVETSGPDGDGVPRGATHPMRVARAWADHVVHGNLDEAARLYAPTAGLHAGGRVAVGPDRIRATLIDVPIFDSGLEPGSVEGLGDVIRIRWAPSGAGDAVETHLAIQRGEIVEQWLGEARSDRPGPGHATIDLSVEGSVPVDVRDRAMEKVGRATAQIGEPVRHVIIRLEWMADPARDRRARARVTVDIDGDLVRARVSAASLPEVVDLLVERLTDRLRHRAEHRLALRRRGPSSGPGEWRHGDVRRPSAPPPILDASERMVVSRPAWSDEPCTPDEAVFDLEVLDLDFLMFTDLASGFDGVVYRRPGGSYAIRLISPVDPTTRPTSLAAIELDPTPAAHITIDQARDHLDRAGEPWVFLTDETTGRGQVLYRRDDGNDGLITAGSHTPCE